MTPKRTHRGARRSRPQPGWQHLLRRHGPEFLAWLEAEGILNRVFGLLAADLESYLLQTLDGEMAGATFMRAIPDVLKKCNDDIYDRPLRAEAYAFMHLLERYRRAWRVLEELTSTANLPLARHGVRTLDVGTGPAPVLYAVNDFYGSLTQFAGARQIDDLRLPAPELVAIEGSHGMQRFVHLFSEWARRASGPFGAQWRDFAEFDPADERAHALKSRIAQIAREDNTSEGFASWWVHDNEGFLHGLHTYRLCVFSNFLTTPEVLERFQTRVDAAFASVTAGGVVLITGSADGRYGPIYDEIQHQAAAAGLRRLDVRARFEPPDPDPCGAIIKSVYTRIWTRLEELGVAEPDRVERVNDLWDPDVPYSTTSFALDAYRRDGSDG